MDKQRFEAYLNLIVELLSSCQGEAPEIWRANSQLIDKGLVAGMELVAAKIAEEEKLNAF